MSKVDIPNKQRAAVRKGTGESATAPVEQVDVQMPGPGQILVKINWTGLCASVRRRARAKGPSVVADMIAGQVLDSR